MGELSRQCRLREDPVAERLACGTDGRARRYSPSLCFWAPPDLLVSVTRQAAPTLPRRYVCCTDHRAPAGCAPSSLLPPKAGSHGQTGVWPWRHRSHTATVASPNKHSDVGRHSTAHRSGTLRWCCGDRWRSIDLIIAPLLPHDELCVYSCRCQSLVAAEPSLVPEPAAAVPTRPRQTGRRRTGLLYGAWVRQAHQGPGVSPTSASDEPARPLRGSASRPITLTRGSLTSQIGRATVPVANGPAGGAFTRFGDTYVEGPRPTGTGVPTCVRVGQRWVNSRRNELGNPWVFGRPETPEWELLRRDLLFRRCQNRRCIVVTGIVCGIFDR